MFYWRNYTKTIIRLRLSDYREYSPMITWLLYSLGYDTNQNFIYPWKILNSKHITPEEL